MKGPKTVKELLDTLTPEEKIKFNKLIKKTIDREKEINDLKKSCDSLKAKELKCRKEAQESLKRLSNLSEDLKSLKSTLKGISKALDTIKRVNTSLEKVTTLKVVGKDGKTYTKTFKKGEPN
jgi:predicted  nucleic acid-binding Zn-ribbon protein